MPVTVDISSHNQQSAANPALENDTDVAPDVVAVISDPFMSVPAEPIVLRSSILNATDVFDVT